VSSQNDFVWLDGDVVRAIHEAQIAEHGGSLGVRDPGLLASALTRPRNAAAYGDPDVAELAALYALGVIKNHPFVDGNKRVGAVLLELFLDMNGYDLVANDEELLPTILSAAAGDANEELIDWIRENVVRRRKR
jgi:death-on-curing protein